MIEAINNPSAQLLLALETAYVGGAILRRDHSSRTVAEIGIHQKGPNDFVTGSDIDASNAIIRAIHGATGEKTITEEADYAPPDLLHCLADYADDSFWIIDPADSTNDYVQSLLSNPDLAPARRRRISNVVVSVARIANGAPEAGALLAPLLGVPPILVAAQKGKGAFIEQVGMRTALTVNQRADTGIVLVSENNHPYISRIKAAGLETVGVSGFVFKLLCVLRPELLRLFVHHLKPEDRELALNLTVVAMASHSSKLYDHAAGKVIADEAGAWTRTPQNSADLPIGPGEQGLIVAVNDRIGQLVVDARIQKK